MALISGGARRIGAAITRSLVADGFRVACGSHTSGKAAAALRDELGEDRVLPVSWDLAAEGDAGRAVARTIERWGRLDLLVNNGAIYERRPLRDLDLAHWRRMLEVNLTGAMDACLAARPVLETSGGCIVNVCDIHGERPPAGYAAYSVSKAGLIALTRALAVELAPGIRVNGVSPGPILFPEGATEEERARVLSRTPMARSGDPSDVAAAVVYLARASFVTGQILAVDGGRSLT